MNALPQQFVEMLDDATEEMIGALEPLVFKQRNPKPPAHLALCALTDALAFYLSAAVVSGAITTKDADEAVKRLDRITRENVAEVVAAGGGI